MKNDHLIWHDFKSGIASNSFFDKFKLVTIGFLPILSSLEIEGQLEIIFGHYSFLNYFIHFITLALFGFSLNLPQIPQKLLFYIKGFPLILSLTYFFFRGEIGLLGANYLLLLKSLIIIVLSGVLIGHYLYGKGRFSSLGWVKVNGSILILLACFTLIPFPIFILDFFKDFIIPTFIILTPISQLSSPYKINWRYKEVIFIALTGALVNSFFFIFLNQVGIISRMHLPLYLLVVHLAYTIAPVLKLRILNYKFALFIPFLGVPLLLIAYPIIAETILEYEGAYSTIFLLFYGIVGIIWFITLAVQAYNLEHSLERTPEKNHYTSYIWYYSLFSILIGGFYFHYPVQFESFQKIKIGKLIPWERAGIKGRGNNKKVKILKSFSGDGQSFFHISTKGKLESIEYLVFNDHVTKWTDGLYFKKMMEVFDEALKVLPSGSKVLIMGLGNYKALKLALRYKENIDIYVVDNFPMYKDEKFRSYLSGLINLNKGDDYQFAQDNIFLFLRKTELKFDYIYDNLTSPNYSSSSRLFSRDFSNLLKKSLTKEGQFQGQLPVNKYERCSYLSAFNNMAQIKKSNGEQIAFIASRKDISGEKCTDSFDFHSLYFSHLIHPFLINQ